MTIVIGRHTVKQIPIKPKGIEFDKENKKEVYLDKSGKKVKKIKVTGSEFKWVYEDGTVCDGKTFKSIKGKPVKPFERTAVIDSYDTIDITELPYFVKNEHTYLLANDKFKDELKANSGKAYSFKYVIRGFKIYRAVTYYDELLDKALMRCYQGDLRKTVLEEGTTSAEIESSDGVESMNLDDLEV